MKRKHTSKKPAMHAAKMGWPFQGRPTLDPASLDDPFFRNDAFAAAAAALSHVEPQGGDWLPLDVANVAGGCRSVTVELKLDVDPATRLVRSAWVRRTPDVGRRCVWVPTSPGWGKGGRS